MFQVDTIHLNIFPGSFQLVMKNFTGKLLSIMEQSTMLSMSLGKASWSLGNGISFKDCSTLNTEYIAWVWCTWQFLDVFLSSTRTMGMDFLDLETCNRFPWIFLINKLWTHKLLWEETHAISSNQSTKLDHLDLMLNLDGSTRRRRYWWISFDTWNRTYTYNGTIYP